MRIRTPIVLTALLAVLATGCVTINVYFPAAAVNKAADQIVREVIGPAPATSAPAPAASSAPKPSGGGMTAVLNLLIPSAQAGEATDLDISTPGIQSIRASMSREFQSEVEPLLAAGAVGFTANGDIAVRDLAAVPLAQRPQVNQIVASANALRAKLYAAIAEANGRPAAEPQIRASFAQKWIQMARPGWYYQDSSGAWKKK